MKILCGHLLDTASVCSKLGLLPYVQFVTSGFRFLVYHKRRGAEAGIDVYMFPLRFSTKELPSHKGFPRLSRLPYSFHQSTSFVHLCHTVTLNTLEAI